MDQPEAHSEAASWRRMLAVQAWRPGASWLVLLVCLLVTGVGWRITRDQEHARAAERFRVRVERIREDIARRMLAYDQVLKGAAGLFAASETVARAEWRAYVLGLGVDEHYPGIRGLGYIEAVKQSGLDSFLRHTRRDFPPGYPVVPFDLVPAGSRKDYFVVKFVEPIERNGAALGYDIATESNRLAAAEAARDLGDAVVTARLRLVQSTNDTAGVLLLRPIYFNGQPSGDTGERRAALEGWVYGAFQMNELMQKVLRDNQGDVDFEVFDGTGMTPQTLLYDHDRKLHAGQAVRAGIFSTNTTLDFANHIWALHFHARPDFGAAERWNKPLFLAIGGLFVSVLVFGITRAVASTESRAQALARDITRTLEVQQRAMSSSSHSIIILDATRPDLPFIYANPAVARLTGYPVEELIGQNGSFLLGPEPEQAGVQGLRDAIRRGEECRVVLHCYRKDGTAFWNEISLSPVKTRGGIVTHFISVSNDISERVDAERHLQSARLAAEATSRAKSEFVANMSHEIRTPLNAVLGMTELALDTPLTSDQRRLLSITRQSATELLGLMNDVLDLSRIEAGKLELLPAPFRLRRVLDHCLASFSSRALEKNLVLTLRVAPELPDALLGDEMRLRQVIFNLLGNALKFTERGEVVIEVKVSSVGGSAPEPSNAGPHEAAEQTLLPLVPCQDAPPASSREGMSDRGRAPVPALEIEFIVSDTGIGVPSDKHQAIFEPFTQADGSITRLYGGTGLGLAISKRLVTLMDGRLWLESQPVQGSRFHFTARFGVAREDDVPLPPEPPPATSPVRARRHLCVLVVEDNPVNAQLVTAFLKKIGHSVRLATNGHEALAAADRGGADLILMDLQMPGLDGLQATARIREQEQQRGGHIPIIALTAHVMAGDRAQCLAAGMDDYLAKPIRRADLFAALERIFPGSAPPPAVVPATDTSPLRLRLLTQLGGDTAALNRLVTIFLESTPPLLAELAAAASDRDLTRLARAAHTLKGSVMQLGDEAARAAALAVEVAAASGQSQAALTALPIFDREVTRLSDELRRLLPGRAR